VKEIIHDIVDGGLRIERTALEALQEAAEAMLVAEFSCKLLFIYTNHYTNSI
jgi:histone H3/H4